jgi:anti-sigma factor (TIGR02949 family)
MTEPLRSDATSADCGCTKAQNNLEEFVRNELCSEDWAEVREHIARCHDCSDEERVSKLLTEAVRRACSEPAPPDLRVVILARLRQAHGAH